MGNLVSYIVLGSGGHARVLLDAIVCLDNGPVIGLTDPHENMNGQLVNGHAILGDDSVIGQYDPESIQLVNGVGSLPGETRRRELFLRFKEQGYHFASLVHPNSFVSASAKLAEGVQVMAGAVIQAGVQIGCNTIINTGTSVDHDSLVGEHCHLAPGSTLCGGVAVGPMTHIGCGVTVVQNVQIGTRCIVGAGALVRKSVGDAMLVNTVLERTLEPIEVLRDEKVS